jgi:putative phosphoribosyl transferase
VSGSRILHKNGPSPKQEIDMRFPDRFKAGQLLAEKLDHYAYRRDVIVLALPPGGVPVGYEVAKALNAPLDILVIRRLDFPNNPALAMGAVCADGALVLNHELIRWLNIGGAKLDDVIAVERAKSQRLDKAYRNDALRLELRDKFAILVDDGMTAASAMRTAIAILRLRHPARIVIAVPVASHSSVLDLRFSSTGLPRSPEAEELVRQQPVRWRADGRLCSKHS